MTEENRKKTPERERTDIHRSRQMHAKAHWIIIFGCSPRCWCDAPKDIDIFRLYLISCVRIVVLLRIIIYIHFYSEYLQIEIQTELNWIRFDDEDDDDDETKTVSVSYVHCAVCCVPSECDQYVSMAEIPFVCHQIYMCTPHARITLCHPAKAHKMSIISYTSYAICINTLPRFCSKMLISIIPRYMCINAYICLYI